MSTDTTISVRVDRELSEALDALAADAGTSKSEIVREVLRDNVVNENLGSLPEHLVILSQRERMIQGMNRVRDLREGFEKRTEKQLYHRFHKGGYDAEGIETIAENYHSEIETLWPEYADEDYTDTRQEKHEWLNNLVENYKRLDSSTGENESLSGGQSDDALRADAKRLLSVSNRGDSLSGGGKMRSHPPSKVVDMLACRPGVERGDAQRIVDAVSDHDPEKEGTEGVADD